MRSFLILIFSLTVLLCGCGDEEVIDETSARKIADQIESDGVLSGYFPVGFETFSFGGSTLDGYVRYYANIQKSDIVATGEGVDVSTGLEYGPSYDSACVKVYKIPLSLTVSSHSEKYKYNVAVYIGGLKSFSEIKKDNFVFSHTKMRQDKNIIDLSMETKHYFAEVKGEKISLKEIKV